MKKTPRLAVTPGEPAGIGPDLIIQLSQTPQDAELVIIADKSLILARAKELGLEIKINIFNANQVASPNKAGEIKLLNVQL